MFTIIIVLILFLTIALSGCDELNKPNYIIANVSCVVSVFARYYDPYEDSIIDTIVTNVMVNVEINKAGGEKYTEIIYPEDSEGSGKTAISASFNVYKDQPLYFIGNIVLDTIPTEYSNYTFNSDIKKIEWSEINSNAEEGTFSKTVTLTIVGTPPDLIED